MTQERWLTPREIAEALGPEQTKKLLDDLAYGKRTRPELLKDVMDATQCVVPSATEFLRELIKNPSLAE